MQTYTKRYMQNLVEPVILIHKIDFSVPETMYLSLLGKIRKDKRKKIERFKLREDALRSLSGELLLKYALEKYFNIEDENEIIAEDDFGKPHLKNKQLFFNISHSGNWAGIVCYVDDAGIDIERIANPPYEIMPNAFTLEEIEQIGDRNPQVNAEQFYRMWTLKESYIKMLGQGLSVSLDSFSIDMRDKNAIHVRDNNRQTADVHFKLFRPDSEHMMAVCLRNYYKDISSWPVSNLIDSLFQKK
jgi:4'-phosphopantetheinyl transferase